jgi:type II secretory pathway component PulF
MGTLREFVFAARDPSGARIEGRIAAENSAIAVARLRAQGLNVERIRAMESPVQAAAPSPRGGVERALRQTVYSAAPGVSLKDLAVLYRQMATLVSAGMPLYQVLVSLEAQTRNNRLRTILRECQAQVMAGGRLSDVLEQHRYAFSDLQIEMIRAAEQGGTLEETLTRLADYLERELNLRRLISQLTLYPKLVLLAALFILGKSFFGDGTPAFSKVIIGALGRTTYTGWDYFMDTALILIELVIAYVVITAVGRAAMVRFPSLRETWERVVVAVPGVGGVSRAFALTRFGRAFSAMYSAGVPLSSAVASAASASGSAIIGAAVGRAVSRVERGESLSVALAETGAFNSLFLDMLRTGEQTGDLDNMVRRAADHLESEAEAKAYQYSHIFSTVVYLIVAVLVGFAVIRFYMGYASSIGG